MRILMAHTVCTAVFAQCCNSHCYLTLWKEYGVTFLPVHALSVPCQERRTLLELIISKLHNGILVINSFMYFYCK
jgi:hypothetical protein